MARKDTEKNGSENPIVLRDEWLNRLQALTSNVRMWADQLDWSTRLIAKKMKDSRLGTYEAPSLMMQKETTRALLDPVARFAPGTDGAVDLYLMPAYDDIASLYFIDGQWRLHYLMSGERARVTTGDREYRPLSKEVLAEVLDEMLAHAAESL